MPVSNSKWHDFIITQLSLQKMPFMDGSCDEFATDGKEAFSGSTIHLLC